MLELMDKHCETFGVPKPVIGCLHMQALPGTPYADPKMTLEEQIRRLKTDAITLQNAGFDALVFANEGDRPYLTPVGPDTVANYVRIATEVISEINVPFGCGVLIDPIATLAVAKAIGAKFIRTYVSGSYEGLFGSQKFNPGKIFRYQKQIGAEDVRVYTYFEAHAGTCLDTRSSAAMLEAGVANMPIAGALFGGAHAGLPPEASHIAKLKSMFPNVPILIGSGGTVENIHELLPHADGVIVGTSIKYDGILWNNVDPNAAEAFIKAAKA
jgi:membrane complex biogenesis BtpA family protein